MLLLGLLTQPVSHYAPDKTSVQNFSCASLLVSSQQSFRLLVVINYTTIQFSTQLLGSGKNLKSNQAQSMFWAFFALINSCQRYIPHFGFRSKLGPKHILAYFLRQKMAELINSCQGYMPHLCMLHQLWRIPPHLTHALHTLTDQLSSSSSSSMSSSSLSSTSSSSSSSSPHILPTLCKILQICCLLRAGHHHHGGAIMITLS